MKLFSLGGSRYGSRVAIQIAAKGLDIPLEILPTPIPPSFKTINPLMLVPVLEIDDGVYLSESQVICEYLEDLYPETSLCPEDPLNRARMRLLIRLFELYYDPPVLSLYRQMRGSDKISKDSALSVLKDVKINLDRIASHLDDGQYAIGNRLSLADCALMPPFLQATLFFPRLGLGNPIAEHPVVSNYYNRTLENTHVAAVLETMKPPLCGWFDRISCV